MTQDQARDVPMIVSCSKKDGTVTPLRFKYADPESDTTHTIDIESILSVTRHSMPGREDYIYICQSTINGNLFKYKLRMHQESGKMSWMFLEQL